MPEVPDPFPLRRSQALVTTASYALVCGMLMMATFTIVQAGEALAPGWRTGVWLWLSPVLALEALLSARFLRRYSPLTQEWLAYRLAEWVILLLLLRLGLYLVEGVGALRTDLSLPWREFITQFFSAAYLAWIFLGGLVWVVAGEFAGPLEQLEVDEQLVELEREARSGPERQQARARLATLILFIGGLLLLAVALLRQDWAARLGGSPPLILGSLNLVVYFILGLALLSLTQFSTLAMRWGINAYPVRADVAGRWLGYGLLFLTLLGGAALLLPTAYASGLLRVLAMVVNFILAALSFLYFLLMAPILLALNSLAKMAGEQPVAPPPEWTPPASVNSLPPSAGAPSEFSEFLLSLLFWVIFVGAIYFAVRHYISQHAGALQALSRIPILKQLIQLGRLVWSWMSGMGGGFKAALQERVQELRRRAAERREAALPPVPGFLSVRRLPLRQQVFFYYRATLQRGRQYGLPRRPAQTPQEYAGYLQAHLPEVERDLQGLTGEFEEARYSRHAVTTGQVSTVRRHWERIRQALRLRKAS